MATHSSPHTPSVAAQPKRSAFPSSHSLIPSSRRPSLSNVNSSAAISSTPSSSETTSSPSFRSLRSLLPFGPNKQPTPISASVSPHVSRSPFANFGSMRKSMTRERNTSLSEVLPVIAIERQNEPDSIPAPVVIRKSLSYSQLENGESNKDEDDTVVMQLPFHRTPSPIPPLSLSGDLSTIIEADTSGISKHLPSASPSPSPPPLLQESREAQSSPDSPETSALDLSTSQVASQVLDAMMAKDIATANEWLNADKAVIVDEDMAIVRGDPNASFNLGGLDPDLAALLSPHRLHPPPSPNKTIEPRPKSIDLSQTPTPSPTSTDFPQDSQPSALPLRRPQQQSALPRLRSITMYSPTRTNSSESPEDDSTAPTTRNGSSDSLTQRRNPAPPSPLSASGSMRRASRTGIHTPSTSRLTSLSGKRGPRRLLTPPTPPTEWGEQSPSLRRPSIEATVRASLDSRPPFRSPPEATTTHNSNNNSPSSDFSTPSRTSLDPSSSLRPGLEALSRSERDRIARTRKRSMSVQDKLGRHNNNNNNNNTYGSEIRPSSSLSGRGNGGGGGSEASAGPPSTEWLGPRTAKAFKAAGLLDFERDQERERNGGVSAGASPGSANTSFNGPSKFGFMSMRTPSEFPHTHSRMGEAGSGGSRRGSGSYSYVQGSGLMESPTFTASSGSRDRETLRSASTAPTSVSGSSLGFFRRDHERDRDRDKEKEKDRDKDRDRERDEIRELKEKHATETGALLGALSDSQRTTRVLREENGELRERLERIGSVEIENEALKRMVGMLRKEVGDLKMQLLLRGTGRPGAGVGTGRRSGLSTPTSNHQHLGGVGTDEEGWSSRYGGGSRDKLAVPLDRSPYRKSDRDEFGSDNDEWLDPSGHSSTPAPASKSQHKRRFSTTSSVFPVPPSNMTMLLHDDTGVNHANLTSDETSRFTFAHSRPVSVRGGTKGHVRAASASSTINISPTTANFSIVTGSPGSLFLKPEHEVHLGDMDSLDLGIRHEEGDDTEWDE